MAAKPNRSESNLRNVRPLDSAKFSPPAAHSKKSTSSKEYNEREIRREADLNIPTKPVSRRRTFNFAKYEITSRRKLSILGEALATSPALSRTTVRAWPENDLFSTTYRVWRSTVAKRYL